MASAKVTRSASARSLDVIQIIPELYPRHALIPALVDDYRECIDDLPPIEVDQHGRLIDGRHRLEAHRKTGLAEIAVIVTEVADDGEFLELAAARNAHGTRSLNRAEKKAVVRSRYKTVPEPQTLERLAARLAVGKSTVSSWTTAIRKTLVKARDTEIIRLLVEEGMSYRDIEKWLEDDGRWPLSFGQIGEVCRKSKSGIIAHRMEIKQYDVVVLDPPWPMQRIQLKSRPNTPAGLDYETMTLAEIRQIEIPSEDGHIYLWTTQRFLRDAFDVFDAWGVRCVWTHVWRKPGGAKPPNLPKSNAEFCLYGRIGKPETIPEDERDWWTILDAPQDGEHSNKPDAFFADVARRWAGRRISMFERSDRSGFDAWGKEAPE